MYITLHYYLHCVSQVSRKLQQILTTIKLQIKISPLGTKFKFPEFRFRWWRVWRLLESAEDLGASHNTTSQSNELRSTELLVAGGNTLGSFYVKFRKNKKQSLFTLTNLRDTDNFFITGLLRHLVDMRKYNYFFKCWWPYTPTNVKYLSLRLFIGWIVIIVLAYLSWK